MPLWRFDLTFKHEGLIMAKELTEAEKQYQKLQGGDTSDVEVKSDLKKNRERAAKDWVGHFFSVQKYVNQAKEDGVSITSEKELVAYIVGQWETTASDKDSAVADLFAA